MSKTFWGSRWLRVFFAALFAAYVVTWAWGVPAVITTIVESDMNANARAAEYYEEGDLILLVLEGDQWTWGNSTRLWVS